MSTIFRRDILRGLFTGSASLGLRSVATGLPAAFLLNPFREARADTPVTVDPARAQFLVLALSDSGEPINTNGPGSYAAPDMVHATTPEFQPAVLSLGSSKATAAQIWNTLPQASLNRAMFMHHATFAGQHGSIGNVIRMMGRTKASEMIPAIYAKHLSVPFATVQATPISLDSGGGAIAISANGQQMPNTAPSAWKELVGQYEAVPGALEKIRNQTTDKLYASLKKRGTRAQLRYLDTLAKSAADARKLGGDVSGILAGITDDGNAGQLQAAIAIIKMNLSPVVCVRLNFGGDNHADKGLENEAKAHVDAITKLGTFFRTLKANGLEDKVTFAYLGVFGRNFRVPDSRGRDHWGNHCTSLMVGKNIRAGVVGGTAPRGGDYFATGIDSNTGAAVVDGGDIKFDDTLVAVGKTLGAAVGLTSETLDIEITGGGKVVKAAMV
jgi:hypothetical protein